MPTSPDLTGKMMRHGVYGRHSLAQHSAGGFGLPGLLRAARAAATAVGDAASVVIADLSAASRTWTLRRTRTSRHTGRTTTPTSSAPPCPGSCAPSPNPACSPASRAPGARTAIADRVYARVAEAATADPEAMETLWHVAVLRIAKPA